MPRQAGDTAEIEITPEMIEAGCRALASYSERLDGDEEGACRVYRAMERARLLGLGPT